MNVKTGFDYIPKIKERLLEKGYTKKQIPESLIKKMILTYEYGFWLCVRKGWVFNTNITARPEEFKANILWILRLYAIQKIHKLVIKYKPGYVKRKR